MWRLQLCELKYSGGKLGIGVHVVGRNKKMINTSCMISLTHRRPISIFTILHQSWHVIFEVFSVHSCQQLMPLPLSLDTARRLSLLSPSMLVNFLNGVIFLQSFASLESMLMKPQWQNFESFAWWRLWKNINQTPTQASSSISMVSWWTFTAVSANHIYTVCCVTAIVKFVLTFIDVWDRRRISDLEETKQKTTEVVM